MNEKPVQDKSDFLYETSIIDGFYERLSYFNDFYTRYLREWINTLINILGEHDVAVMLEDGANRGLIVDNKVVYDGDEQAHYITRMTSFLPEVDSFTKAQLEDITDRMFGDTLPNGQTTFWRKMI